MIRLSSDEIPWGQLMMKIIQAIALLITAILAGAWSSQGVRFTDLDRDDYNQEPLFEFLIVISVLGILWAIVSVIIFVVKQDLPAIVVVIITLILAFFLIISVPLFASGVYELSQTMLARSSNLNFAALEAACFFGVVGTMAYIGDLILEIIALVFAVRKLGIKKLYLGSCCDL